MKLLSNCLLTAVSCAIAATAASAQNVTSFSAAAEPSAVALAASRQLAQRQYQITTSEVSAGLIVARLSGTPTQLLNSVNCRRTTLRGDVTHTVTVTAQPSPGGGSSVQISSGVTLGANNPEFQSCEPHGSVESAIRSAILALPSSTTAVPRISPSAAAVAPSTPVSSGSGARALSINQLVEMVRAKLPNDVVSAAVRRLGISFQATPELLIELKTADATDDLLRAVSETPATLILTPDARVQADAAAVTSSQSHSGRWEGDGSDSTGPGHFISDLTETDGQLGGSFVIVDGRSGMRVAGTLSGQVVNGVQLQFTMIFPRGAIASSPRCEGAVQGLAGRMPNGILNGSYSGRLCGSRIQNGTFALRRVE